MTPALTVGLIGCICFALGEWLGGRLWMLGLRIGGVYQQFKKGAAPIPWYARALSNLGAGLMLVSLVLAIRSW